MIFAVIPLYFNSKHKGTIFNGKNIDRSRIIIFTDAAYKHIFSPCVTFLCASVNRYVTIIIYCYLIQFRDKSKNIRSSDQKVPQTIFSSSETTIIERIDKHCIHIIFYYRTRDVSGIDLKLFTAILNRCF